MTENNSTAAQNKMGELFVDIGSKGLGSTVKSLNSLSASFLLAKKGAQEFVKPIKEAFKQGMFDATQWSKLSSIMGGTPRQMQAIQAYFKSRQVDTGLLNDIAKIQQQLYNAQTGLGDVDPKFTIALARMGKNVSEYDSSLESVLKLIEEANQKTKALTPVGRQSVLNGLGLSGEWAYLFDRPDFKLNEALALSDEEIEQILKASEAVSELNTQIDALKNKGTAKIAPIVTNTVKGVNKVIEDKSPNNTYKKMTPDQKKQLRKAAQDLTKNVGIGVVGAGSVGALGGPIGAALGAVVGGSAGVYKTYKDLTKDKKGTQKIQEPAGWNILPDSYKNSQIEKPSSKMKQIQMSDKQQDAYDSEGLIPKLPNLSALPNNFGFNSPLDTLPNDISKNIANNINITITNNNKISSIDPEQTAREINKLDESNITAAKQQLINQPYIV